jgi:hypothetical protein
MQLHSDNAIHNAMLKLIRLLDPFEEPAQVRSRMWRAGSLLTLCGKLALKAYQKAFLVDQWYLLFDLNDEISTSFGSFRKIVPPKDRFWADPHVVWADGRYYIFVEEYVHRLEKGHISVIEMDEHGNYQGPIRVLEKEYHLSYPCVFEWQRKYFMVPESAANATIDLYECVEFPHKWELKMTLMKDVYAVDTTLFHHNGRWWLFTGMAEDAASLPRVHLCLFFSDDVLTNNWSSHPLNPIVSDAKRGRPAGRVLTIDGRIFRPSQDCSRHYGYGIDLNEISSLSDSEYVERQVLSVRPGWDNQARGTHTFVREGQLTMIDAFTKRSRLSVTPGWQRWAN